MSLQVLIMGIGPVETELAVPKENHGGTEIKAVKPDSWEKLQK